MRSLTALELGGLELGAALVIGAFPSCPKKASALVDRLTVRRDALLGVEVRL